MSWQARRQLPPQAVKLGGKVFDRGARDLRVVLQQVEPIRAANDQRFAGLERAAAPQARPFQHCVDHPTTAKPENSSDLRPGASSATRPSVKNRKRSGGSPSLKANCPAAKSKSSSSSMNRRCAAAGIAGNNERSNSSRLTR